MTNASFGSDIPNQNAGFLTDAQIRSRLEAGSLFAPTTWIDKSIRECSYLARLGNEYELVLADRSQEASTREVTKHYLQDGECLTVHPGDTALLFFEEEFRMPANTTALTVPRGLLYAQCLAPGVSYVDPGYVGKFYLPVTNISMRSIEIPHNLEIARVLFFDLVDEVEVPFNKEKTRQLATTLKTMPTRPPLRDDELATMSDDDLLREVGPAASELFRRLQSEPGNTDSSSRSKRSLALGIAAAIGIMLWPPLYVALISDDWRERLGKWAGAVIGAVFLAIVGVVIELLIKPYLQKRRDDA